MFDIHKIAKLSRLHLEPTQEKSLCSQLETILGHVDSLQAVDTSAIDGYGLPETPSRFREDDPAEGGPTEERVRLAERVQRNMFFVPKVIGEGDA